MLRERPVRKENIKIEQKKKVKRLKPFYALSLILCISAALWAAYLGKADLVTILMGAASLFLGFQLLKATVEPNSFQVKEHNAVSEINELLKQRRVE